MSKPIDLVGQRFASLAVISKTNQKKDKYTVWKCKCDCGNIVYANTRELKRGRIKSCGCKDKHNSNQIQAEDLSGQRFGKLTVLSRVEDKNNRTCWKCKCDCGNITEVNAYKLKQGRVKSCGCLLKETRNKIKDIKGKRFGKLVALYPTNKRDIKSSVYWHCRCDCGNEVDVTVDVLQNGNQISCGCIKKENQKHIFNTLHRIDGTCVEWIEKRKHRKDNTSGFRGVSSTRNGNYRVSIGFKGRNYYLGTFKEYDQAVQVRLEAEEMIHDGFVQAYHQWKKENLREPFIFDVCRINGTFKISTNVKICENSQNCLNEKVYFFLFNIYQGYHLSSYHAPTSKKYLVKSPFFLQLPSN